MIGSFSELAYAELPDEYDNSVPDPFAILLATPDPQLLYLVQLYPYNEDLQSTLLSPAPFSSVAFGEADVSLFGGIDTVYLSDQGYTTKPDASVPDRHFPAVVKNALSFDASIISGDEFGIASSSYGSMMIYNGDGRLDYLSELQWSGRRVVVKAGARSFPYDDFTTVFDGTVAAYEQDDDNIVLTITDNRAKTDTILTVPTYEGTGGLEGGDDLEGKNKPLCFGEVYNIEPVLVDAANLVYQIHHGSMDAVLAVRDSGVALTPGGNVADITLAVPSAGTFVTQLSGGYIKLGSTPAGRITADAQGSNDNAYVSTGPDIALEVLRYRLGAKSFMNTEIDLGAFASLETVLSGAMGIYLRDRVTASEVIDRLLLPCACYWTFTRLGVITCGAVQPVTEGDFSFNEDSVADEGVQVVASIPPSWRISVGYQPLGVIQSEDELAAATTVADRAFLTEEYRSVTSEDETLKTLNTAATERAFYTCFAAKADAEGLLTRLRMIYATTRKVYRAPIYNALFRSYLGGSVTLTYPRHGLASGKHCLVVGVSEDTEAGQTNMVLWG